MGGNPLDAALWQSPAAATERATIAGYRTMSVLPFDHQRQMVSVLIRDADGVQTLVTKGAPESVLQHCIDVPAAARAALAAEFTAGNRVVAVATKPAPNLQALNQAEEDDLHYAGLLVFLDPPNRTRQPRWPA